MAYYRPLERKDGRFDYVCSNDAGTFAIGYCFNGEKPFYSLAWDELSDVVKGIYGTEDRWNAEKARHAPRLHEYHNTGHETEDEAIRCHRRYEVLEHSLRHEDPGAQKKCAKCGIWTQHRIIVGGDFHREYVLCLPCDEPETVMDVHLKGKG